MNLQRLFQELKRRNVFRVATAYAIAGWLIIQICATTFPYLNLPEWLITATIIFVLIGFPLSLIFAWAFELTPDGIQKSNDVDITASVTASTGKKLNGIIISVLSVALFFVLVERIFFAKASFLNSSDEIAEVETASIAVLPFVNMSSDEENEFFSDGLSEELLNALAKVEDMQVAGRTSSFKFKGQNEDLKLIGEQLGVANILEGSVRKSGDRLRITAQLIRVSDGFHMWSETYDRELTASDIFDIQEEISRQVMSELKVRLLPIEDTQLTVRPTQDIEAYNAYLAATQLETSRNAEDIELAILKYKDAIRIDPSFALAYAELGLAYDLLLSYGNVQRDEYLPLIKENADKAISLDADLGRGYQALAMYYLATFEHDIAFTYNTRALELLPHDVEVWNQRHTVYERLGNGVDGFQALKTAYEMDPLNPPTATNYARHLRDDDIYDEAIAIYDQIINAFPRYSPAYIQKAIILRDAPYGDLYGAFEYMYTAYEQNPEDLGVIREIQKVALDVDFIPLAGFFKDEAVRLFEFNPGSYSVRVDYNIMVSEYEEAENLIKSGIEQYGDQILRFAASPLIPNLYYQAKYEEAITFLEKAFPEFTEDEIEINSGFYYQAYNYAVLMKVTGEEEKYEALTESLCTYIEDSYQGNADFQFTDRNYHEELSNCAALRGDVEGHIKYMNTIIVEYNSIANLPLYLKRLIHMDFINEDPQFIAYYEEVFEGLHTERAKIIEFMKEENFWRDEWEITE